MPSLRITTIIQSQADVRWRRVCGLLVIAVAASLLSVKLLLAVYAAAGDLDPSFGTGGKLDGVPGIGMCVIQADGKLLAIRRSPNDNFWLSRFKVDGSPDSTFGLGGQVETSFGVYAQPMAIALQPDGRIVVAGYKNGSGLKIVLARHRTNGSLDLTFSAGGIAEIPHVNAISQDMALQSDGKIVVAGTVFEGVFPDYPNLPLYRSLLIRLNEDGTLDSSFATSGYLTITVWDSQSNPREGFDNILIQGDGRILASAFGAAFPYSKLVRFFANGQRDLTFGNGGAFTSAISEKHQAHALQPDGKIVIAVKGFGYNQYDALVRLSADGIPDNTFGHGGRTVADPLAVWNGIGLQEDGRVIVTGGTNNYYTGTLRLSRFQSDGSLIPASAQTV